MRCSCPDTPLLLLLLLPLIAASCPVLGPGADPQTKAYLAPLVFQGTLTALARRGPVLRATFRVDRTLKGQQPQPGPDATVEFAVRENPARCRGAPAGDTELIPGQSFIVFAAWRRRKMIATAAPEDIARKKAVARVLCDQCAKAPSIRRLKDTTLDLHSKLKLKCKISGNPPPRVTWYKNGHRVRANSRLKIRAKRRHSHLVINRVSADDNGNYECRATNVLGNDTAAATVIVSTETTRDSTTWHIKKLPCPKKNFCLNGGTCSYYEIVDEYVCECAEGYRGQRCESKAISTLSSPSPADSPKAPPDMDATTHLLHHYWGR